MTIKKAQMSWYTKGKNKIYNISFFEVYILRGSEWITICLETQTICTWPVPNKSINSSSIGICEKFEQIK